MSLCLYGDKLSRQKKQEGNEHLLGLSQSENDEDREVEGARLGRVCRPL